MKETIKQAYLDGAAEYEILRIANVIEDLNINILAERYAKEQVEKLNNVRNSFYCSTKRGCLEQCDNCALTELSTPC
jgi:radical SAM superfamily enzyme YgiQ (UPF0313 family)